MDKKYKAGLHLKQFVTFIKKQIRKNVKCSYLDQSQEFNI